MKENTAVNKKEVQSCINRSQLFLDELFKLYKKHNISISHEDGQGGFILNVDQYMEDDIKWIHRASIEIDNVHIHKFNTGWAYQISNEDYIDL